MTLFSRPAWATKSQTTAPESEKDLFSHSNSFQDIVADRERRKREVQERKKAKQERRTSEKREIKDEPEVKTSAKKRRITAEDSDAILGHVGYSRPVEDDDFEPIVYEEEQPVRRSPRTSRHIDADSLRKAIRPPLAPQVIELNEDSDDDEVIAYEDAAPALQNADLPDEDSDEELAELARKARRERQQKEFNRGKSQTPDLPSNSPGPATGTSHAGMQRAGTPPPDPVVQIMITSRIPNTNPLIVHRKLSQNLQEIRRVWCMKQNFSPAFTNQVFFTYRMRKVYDLTTCRSLGLYVDDFGHIVLKGAEGKNGVDKVHIEAVTQEVFDQMKAEKEEEAKRRSGELSPEGHTDAGAGDGDPVSQPKSQSVKLVMKAKKREDFKLLVKPNTPIERIIAAYCRQHGIDNRNNTAFLEFDGERLDPEQEVQDTEITDMDCVEVHFG